MSRSALAVAKRWASSDPAASTHGLSHKIRSLLRETAQPVAVVTSFMPNLGSTSSSATSRATHFHGATLSSFTSISMSPHPLVAFSLRVPSRMATTLADLSATASSASAHMVINLLAAPQTRAAVLFSRSDLHPRPFDEPDLRWSHSLEGLPILHGSLGAMSCRVVGAPWPLRDLAALGDKQTLKEGDGSHGGVDVGDVESELFIAQVIRMEDVPPAEVAIDDTLRTSPLLYHRRSYTTVPHRSPLDSKIDG
ncbi:flavin reductase like domain-containing protein [Gloeopeniophorella convolvens]|nr:flavin reductase like domain-containing protein [Gloeopeniophorella convolvens]